MHHEIGSGWRRLRPAFAAGALATALVFNAGAARADFPDRPIKIVVPFAPGGASDQVARILSEPLSKALGQAVVVENRPGAGGNVGIGIAANAAPDGYTWLVASSAFVVNPNLAKAVTFDPLKSFDFVTEIGASPNILVARPEAGVKTMAELIERAKAEPGKWFYSSAGVGTTPHLTGELIAQRAGVKLVHVPMSGAGPAVQAVLSGDQVQLASSALSVVQPHLEAKTLVPIVQTGAERWKDLPDVPTLAEAGMPDAVSETFQAIFVPAGVPKPVLDKIVSVSTSVLKEPAVRQLLEKAGFSVSGAGPDALKARIVEELPMWKGVIESAGVVVQ